MSQAVNHHDVISVKNCFNSTLAGWQPGPGFPLTFLVSAFHVPHLPLVPDKSNHDSFI